ncbi:hypothetical protein ACJIZ3_024065 [Penstemon smallii]|uniref:Transmembrane protein n=1 Tax=Penstemon smallii TaxID=265156 RepID=A0ABD3TQS1_9LAMI
MARFLVYCLILVNAHLILAIASEKIEKHATARKLGNHNIQDKIAMSSPGPPSESPEFSGEVSESGETGSGAPEQVMKINHHHHHSIDSSIAGGGVILGGLATTFLVAIFCYIRATRRKNIVEPTSSPNNSSIGMEEKS